MTVAGQADKLSMDELREMFGPTLPMDAAKLIWPEFFLKKGEAPHYDPLHVLRDKLRTIAAQHRREAEAGEPEGWVLVPRAPTSMMLAAGAVVSSEAARDGEAASPYEIWRNMLAASPSSPASAASDEQAEVVGDDEPISPGMQAVIDGTRAKIRAAFASPPPVAKGGVTEEQLLTALRTYWREPADMPLSRFSQGDQKQMRAALTAALAVGDEGKREGWQPIETVDRSLTARMEFPGVPAASYSHPVWCRSEHGKPFEASWVKTDAGKEYWWAWDLEDVADPDEWFPHPLSLPNPPSRGEGE